MEETKDRLRAEIQELRHTLGLDTGPPRTLREEIQGALNSLDVETTKNPHAVELGRKGGQVKSAAKTAAARKNATRPRKKAAPRES